LIYFLHQILHSQGYCSSIEPKVFKREIKYNYNATAGYHIPFYKEGINNNTTRYGIRFNTYSFSSLNLFTMLFM
jgi:hypothetical protein